MSKKLLKVIISGGGSGGHIYPAIAIADELKNKFPEAEILFIGALGKMEMEKVPNANYPIKGLPIRGIERGLWLKNLSLPFYLMKSIWETRKIIKEFKPNLVIGTGGYASGPTLWVASILGIPSMVQEQNAFPGITNKLLSKKVEKICVAYDGMEKYFPKEKIEITGNPIRDKLFSKKVDRVEAIAEFGLDLSKPIVLSVGGSQGARSINNVWKDQIKNLLDEGIQLIWQVGKADFEKIQSDEFIKNNKSIYLAEFIYDMDKAYAASDLVVSRAGAIAISELSAVAKPTILVPLPSAAENHQEKNAMHLVQKNAAVMVKNLDLEKDLVKEVVRLIQDKKGLQELSENIFAFAKMNATREIVEIASKLIK